MSGEQCSPLLERRLPARAGELSELRKAVEQAAGLHETFELDIESVGCFGGRTAKVLWVGTGRGSDSLSRLQEDVEKQLASAGWPAESRRFTGHLTLCRIRSSRAGLRLAELSKDYRQFELGSMSVAAVCVHESQLTPTGPLYTRLGNYRLR